jgi:hypothetical protein
VSVPLQFAAHFQMIVDLAVENNHRIAIAGNDRLIPAFNVDDLQARSAERNTFRFMNALLIWTSMENRRNSVLDAPGYGGTTQVCKTGYTAQCEGCPYYQ